MNDIRRRQVPYPPSTLKFCPKLLTVHISLYEVHTRIDILPAAVKLYRIVFISMSHVFIEVKPIALRAG